MALPSPNFRSAPSLVGRGVELADLTSRLGLAGEPTAYVDMLPPVVLLAGDAGVGKTRLLTELRDRAKDGGWTVLAGHCLDLGDSGSLPYLPFSEVLGRLEQDGIDGDPADGGFDHAALASTTLTRLLPTSRSRDSMGDGDRLDRGDLFAAVHAVLDRAAQIRPLLLVIEDAHWADQSSRELLSFLFSRSYAGRFALVVSYRSDDLHRRHPLRRQVADWTRFPHVSRLPLGPLSNESVRELVGQLHAEPLTVKAVQSIVDRAEGNAFFVEELVSASDPQGWVPPELADVLLVRLDRLDDDARTLVRAASAAGRSVSHELLTEVVDLEPAALDAGIRSAVEEHVLTIRSGSGYSFRHALLAEAVYDDLLPGERTRLHARYADLMSERRDLASAAELARHARLAADLDTALLASIEAGHEAMSVGGPDEAAVHYERALALLSDPGLAQRVVVDVSLLVSSAAMALATSGHPDRGVKLVDEQLAALPRDADVTWRARMLAFRADVLSMTETTEVPANVSAQALELLSDEPTRLRAQVLAVHARLSFHRGDYAAAEEAGLEALALAERHNLDKLASDAITTLSALKRQGPTTALRAALVDAIASSEASGAELSELRARYLLGRSYQDWGELDEALAAFQETDRRGREAGVPWSMYPFSSRWHVAFLSMVRGDWDTAVAATALEPGAPRLSRLSMDIVRLTIAAARGEDIAAELAEMRSSWCDEGTVALYASVLEIEAATTPEAVLTVHDDIAEVLSAIWHPRFAARVRLGAIVIGRLADFAGDLTAEQRRALDKTVDELLRQGREVADRYTSASSHWGPEGRAWTSRLEAEARRWRWVTGAGDTDPAELVAAWRATEAGFVEFGHVHELGRVRAILADVLRGTGDPAAARDVADQARATARNLGAKPLLARLGPAGQQRRDRDRARDTVSELTPREEEVLALVAQGRSNGEIGKQLFISTKTVSVHVSNILAKLGASSRTEAAAIAHRRQTP